MKPLKSIGMVLGILGLCALFGYAGSVLSDWDQPVHASNLEVVTRSETKQPSAVQTAAIASAQETTDLTQ